MDRQSAKRPRRAVDGVILLNKPLGLSSQQAVSRVRYALNAEKAGHTGTLDPAAAGLLPVCLGEATKFSHWLLNADKAYTATVKLGVTTDTGDAEGRVIAEKPPVTDRELIFKTLEKFRGEITQVPPMHSALKHQGKPLYEYARKGETIEREARTVVIHELQVFYFKEHFLTLQIRCSKGTYIRVLAEDIGAALGCGASLVSLTRTATGAFELADPRVCTLDQLSAAPEQTECDRFLLPLDSLLAILPAFTVDHSDAARLLLGQKLGLKHLTIRGFARVYGPSQQFLGVVEVGEGGRTVPQRMLAQAHVKLEKTPS